jgi:hypothetical protein
MGVDVDLGVVAAMQAGDIEPADAVPAHVAERHRADRFVGSCHDLPTLRGHRRRTAISLEAGTLNWPAAFSIAEISSLASTVPSSLPLAAAR